ncbi:hypothetical protein IH601_00945 [Candidatus Bipolaricaulota bacterium]|nr:hypothetical protein [Candidatus Bipolaricaulota bacterium]
MSKTIVSASLVLVLLIAIVVETVAASDIWVRPVECTKLSDNAMAVLLEIGPEGLVEGSWFRSEGSDGSWIWWTMLPAGRLYLHTFTDLTAENFPLSVTCSLYTAPDEARLIGSSTADLESCGEHLFPAEINVQQSGLLIPDGGTDELDKQLVGRVERTYAVDNTAGLSEELNVTSISAFDLHNVRGFTVETPLPLDIPAGGTVLLVVSFSVDDVGLFSLNVEIASNDTDEDPYDITICGIGDSNRSSSLTIIPTGEAGEGRFLDRGLDLAEGQDASMMGLLPLSGVYAVGEIVTGSCQIIDQEIARPVLSFVHVFTYAVDLESSPEEKTLLDHWMAEYDRESRDYLIEWDTSGLVPGCYDLYLSFENSPSQTMRIELIPPEE